VAASHSATLVGGGEMRCAISPDESSSLLKPSGAASQPMRRVAMPVMRHSMPNCARISSLFSTSSAASARPTLPKPSRQRLKVFMPVSRIRATARR
jgi:hypothetical protein